LIDHICTQIYHEFYISCNRTHTEPIEKPPSSTINWCIFCNESHKIFPCHHPRLANRQSAPRYPSPTSYSLPPQHLHRCLHPQLRRRPPLPLLPLSLQKRYRPRPRLLPPSLRPKRPLLPPPPQRHLPCFRQTARSENPRTEPILQLHIYPRRPRPRGPRLCPRETRTHLLHLRLRRDLPPPHQPHTLPAKVITIHPLPAYLRHKRRQIPQRPRLLGCQRQQAVQQPHDHARRTRDRGSGPQSG